MLNILVKLDSAETYSRIIDGFSGQPQVIDQDLIVVIDDVMFISDKSNSYVEHTQVWQLFVAGGHHISPVTTTALRNRNQFSNRTWSNKVTAPTWTRTSDPQN